MDTSRWSIEENDAAMRAVVNAQDDIRRANLLDDVAFRILVRELIKEQQRDNTPYAA
jgi:hypothetical protein